MNSKRRPAHFIAPLVEWWTAWSAKPSPQNPECGDGSDPSCKRSNCLLAAVTVFVLIGLTGCSREQEPQPTKLRPVVTLKLDGSAHTIKRVFSGTATPARTRVLSFRIGGTITELNPKVGDLVYQGQRLATLDTTDFQIQVQQAKASELQARAKMSQSHADFERTEALYVNENVSRSVYDRDEAAWLASRAQYDASVQNLLLASNRVEYCELTAPITSTVADVPAEENQNVNPGQAIITLADSSDLQIETGIPEALITQVKQGDRAKVRFDVVRDQEFDAVVKEVAVTASATSTYLVTLDILSKENPAYPLLRPGMTGEVTTEFRTENPNVIVVPQASIIGSSDGQAFAWVVLQPVDSANGEATVEKRAVEKGPFSPAGLIITGGLAENDLLVIRGMHRMKEGMKVRVTDL